MKKIKTERAVKPTELDIASITAAEWNTHSAKPTSEQSELMDSIRANGLIQRITVRPIGGEKYEIIDGHRRYRACKILGYKTIPADVIEVGDTEAQLMTATANIQRLDNDPILEAELIERLSKVKTQAQIAAIIGKDEKYVARRQRLTALTAKWKAFFARCGEYASPDDMEEIAAYSREIQDEVYEECEVGEVTEDNPLDIDEVLNALQRRLRKLDEDTIFDTLPCAKCPYNTATQSLLFPQFADKDARCQNGECYKQKWNAAIDERIAAIRAKKITIAAAKDKWSIPNYWSATSSKEHKNKHPYMYEDDTGLKHILWTRYDNSTQATAPAQTEEEKAEAKRIRKAHLEWSRTRRQGFDKIRETLRRDTERIITALINSPRFIKIMRTKYTRMATSWISELDLIDITRVLENETLGINSEEYIAIINDDPANEKEKDNDAN